MMHKKSQTEIFGLVIVVLLVSLLMIMVLVFVIGDRSSSIVESYSDQQIANTMIKALLTTSVPDCQYRDFNEIIIDAFRPASVLYCSGGRTSLEFLNDEIPRILEHTVEEWGKDYVFYIHRYGEDNYADSPVKFSNREDNCTGATRIEPGIQPLTVPPGITIMVRLSICE